MLKIAWVNKNEEERNQSALIFFGTNWERSGCMFTAFEELTFANLPPDPGIETFQGQEKF